VRYNKFMKVHIGPNYLVKIPLLLLTWLVLFISVYGIFILGDGFSEFYSKVNIFELLVVSIVLLALVVGAPLMTYQLLRKQEFLELDPEGFTDNTTFASYRVHWSEVASFAPWESEKPGSAHIILVNLKDPDSFYERSNYKAIGGLFTQSQTEITPYAISLMGLSKNRNQIIELLNQYLIQYNES